MKSVIKHTRRASSSALSAAGRGQHRRLSCALLRRAGFAFFVAVFCASLFSQTIQAATTCVPRAIGVPGQSAPPNWWDMSASPNAPNRFSDRLDDPRWRGAANYTRGTGTAEHVAFRALHSTAPTTTGLYLSWNVKVAPSLAANTDNRLFVGFSPGGGLDDVIISIQLNNSSPGLATSQYGATIFTKPAASPGDAYTGANVPAWVTDRTRIWVQNNPSNAWAIEMMVPISNAGLASGLNLPTTFKMWYELRVMPQMGSSYITYKFPQGVADIGVNGMSGNDEYPATNTWEDIRLTTGTADSPDPMCPTDGVSLKVGQIGTTNNPTSRMNLNSQNTFVARPLNNTGQAIPAGQLQATFYIANWGSQVGLNDSGDPAGLWVKLRNGDKVPTTAITNNMTEANISFPLTFNQAEKDPFLNGQKTLHQCMLVQLTSTTDLKFLNDSAFRNMDFVNASRFERDAEISVVGLPALAGSPRRDVYLYVETANMPARVSPSPTPTPTPTPTPIPVPGSVTGAATINRPGRGNVTGELDPVMPTYRVHAYHDTGRRVTRAGTTYTILEPQGSFGYYVTHEGELEGWRHNLTGAEQLSPNFYRIGVPNNGAAKVKTIIEAIEPNGGGGGGGNIPADASDKPWGLSLHAGASIPHDNFNTVFNPGPNFGVDLEYRLNNRVSLEALYTFHRFRGEDFGLFTVEDLNLHQFSGNLKVFAGSGSVRPFLNGGGGVYHFDFGGGGSDTRGGVNVGGGLQFNITPTFAIEGSYNFHSVFTPGPNVKFSTAQGGIRFRF